MYKPYMIEKMNPLTRVRTKVIWETDSYAEATKKLDELNEKLPRESLVPVAILPWSAEVSVQNICEDECDHSQLFISKDEPTGAKNGDKWYKIIDGGGG